MKLVKIVAIALLLGGCASQEVSNYGKEKPAFDITHFFAGKTEGWGMFQKRGGLVVKRFHVDIDGHAVGNDFVLDEHFVYSDGSTQKRVWTLTPQADGSWQGRAGDVVGTAIGHAAGNALNWRYVLHLPVDNTSYDVDMDDWMYQMDDKTLVNRTRMSKLGVDLGEVTLFFRKAG
jgi:hypothetical protein